MSQYLVWQIERSLARPSRRETLDAIRREPPMILDPAPADVLREERTLASCGRSIAGATSISNDIPMRRCWTGSGNFGTT